jgi:hypothetical protein
MTSNFSITTLQVLNKWIRIKKVLKIHQIIYKQEKSDKKLAVEISQKMSKFIIRKWKSLRFLIIIIQVKNIIKVKLCTRETLICLDLTGLVLLIRRKRRRKCKHLKKTVVNLMKLLNCLSANLKSRFKFVFLQINKSWNTLSKLILRLKCA